MVRQFTLEEVIINPQVKTFVAYADHNLKAIGYTEHSYRHTERVAKKAKSILDELGHDSRQAELAAIAGYLHDIGNVVARHNHSQQGAIISMQILKEMGMDFAEIAQIVGAIGNHDEGEGQAVNNISAAVILADKSDVHRERVRNKEAVAFDIHDRVNYAVTSSSLDIDTDKKVITLKLVTDDKISNVMEYFEIFLTRMLMCRRAADYLDCTFSLIINDVQLL